MSLTVSLSMSSTFIPGPLFSIILEMYCFTASVTFMMAAKRKQQQQQLNTTSSSCGGPVTVCRGDLLSPSDEYQLSCSNNTAASFLPGWWVSTSHAQRLRHYVVSGRFLLFFSLSLRFWKYVLSTKCD